MTNEHSPKGIPSPVRYGERVKEGIPSPAVKYGERVKAARIEKMRTLADKAWLSILEGLDRDGEDLADCDAEAVSEWIADYIATEGLPCPRATVEELRELVPKLVRYVSRDSLAEVASDLPREALAAAVVQAVPKLKRGVLESLMRMADTPPEYWFASEDGVSDHDADIKEFAKVEARRRLDEAMALDVGVRHE
jgi:hypothetical protein